MSRNESFKMFYALSLAWQIGFLIILPLLAFLFLGLWGDKKLHTSPLFLIISILCGIGLTVFEIYHLLDPLIKKNTKK